MYASKLHMWKDTCKHQSYNKKYGRKRRKQILKNNGKAETEKRTK
jgi:hypothetical protein